MNEIPTPICLTCKNAMTEEHAGLWICWGCDAVVGERESKLAIQLTTTREKLEATEKERDEVKKYVATIQRRTQAEFKDIAAEFRMKFLSDDISAHRLESLCAAIFGQSIIQLRIDRDTALAELAKVKGIVAKLVEALQYAGINKDEPFNRLEHVIKAERSKSSGDNWDYWNFVLEKFRAVLALAAPFLAKGAK